MKERFYNYTVFYSEYNKSKIQTIEKALFEMQKADKNFSQNIITKNYKKANTKKIKHINKQILINLFYSVKAKNAPLKISLDNNQLHKHKISFKLFKGILQFLQAKNLIEIRKGYYDCEQHKGSRTTIKATEYLAEKLKIQQTVKQVKASFSDTVNFQDKGKIKVIWETQNQQKIARFFDVVKQYDILCKIAQNQNNSFILSIDNNNHIANIRLYK